MNRHVGCGADIEGKKGEKKLHSEDNWKRSQHHSPRRGCDARANALGPSVRAKRRPEQNKTGSDDQFDRGKGKVPKKVI